jgi:small-conductance mechanosensitive channel
MTWLGKILAFFVFVGAVASMYLNVQAFVLRTNWKAEADKWRQAYEQIRTARESEYQRFRSTEDVLQRQLSIERRRISELEKSVADLVDRGKRETDAVRELQKLYDEADIKAVQLQASRDALIKEVSSVRMRNEALENDRQRLVIAAEEARREALQARISERAAQFVAEQNAQLVESLREQLRNRFSGDLRTALDKPAPPVLPNLRGEVTAVKDDLVVLSIGYEAGLNVGTELDIYRTQGQPRYLGTVRITSAANLYPKQAVATFFPARKVSFNRLTPEEKPRPGDLVRPPEFLGIR